jgi:hypothetical protein
MTASLKEICSNCMGLSGDISIVRNFFGYSSIPAALPGVPGTLSLLQQLKLIKNGPYIRLHIKIIDPNPGSITIDQQVNAMRQLYGSVGIGVVIGSFETLNEPNYLDTFCDKCTTITGEENVVLEVLNGEMRNLFATNLNYVSIEKIFHYDYPPTGEKENITITRTLDIVIFYVNTVTFINKQGMLAPLEGCAAFPKDTLTAWFIPGGTHNPPNIPQLWFYIPGAVITRQTTIVWTLAHEVGHVLGLSHVKPPNSDRLMNNGAVFTNTPPDLVNTEVQRMKISDTIKKC